MRLDQLTGIAKEDLERMRKSIAEQEERSQKFYDYFEVEKQLFAEAALAHSEFCSKFDKSGLGRGFFQTPVAKKAFVIGYLMGKNSRNENMS